MSNENTKNPMTFGRFLAILSVILVFVALICAIVGTVRNQMDSDRHNYTKDVQVIDDIVHVTVRGDSMSPTINKDALLIADKFDGNISSLSVGQIVTFKTQIYVDGAFYDSYDTKRIIQIHQDGTIIVRGDNQNEKNGRDWVNYTQSTDGTRCESISVYSIVAVCGEKHTHTFTTSVVAPTCTAGGYTTYTCFCGYSYKGNETVALGHSYAEHIVDATCTTDGYIEHICSRCGNAYNSDKTNALGHEYIDEVSAPTCTENGYTKHTCSRCGDSYRDNTTSATGVHSYEAGSVTIGDCPLSSYQTYTCSNCGSTKQEFVSSGSTISTYHNDLAVGNTCEHCGHSVYSKANDTVFMSLGGNNLSVEYYGAKATEINGSLKQYVTNVFFADSVTSIGDYAFSGCSGLKSITIPDSVTSIGGDAFRDTGLTSVTIPDSVTSISEYAFYNCPGLTSVTIGNSVTSIGGDAFYGCTGLTSVYFTGDIAMWCSMSGLSSLTWNSSIKLYIKGEELTGDVVIPSGVSSIPAYAFCNCTGLTSITIPDSVTSIGSSAFRGCTGLTSVTIPDSVTSISEYAFYNCPGLTSVTIGNSVTSIGDRAFSGLSSFNYNGTKVQWNEISKDSRWNAYTSYVIYCSDGTINK